MRNGLDLLQNSKKVRKMPKKIIHEFHNESANWRSINDCLFDQFDSKKRVLKSSFELCFMLLWFADLVGKT